MTALVKLYEHILLRNLSAVTSIESSIRNITWFLPGRFEDSEIASEGLTTLLSLISSYHDTLLHKRLDPSLSLPPRPFSPGSSRPKNQFPDHPEIPPRTQPLLPPTSDHNRYTRYWARTSIVYRRASRGLTTIGYVQLLLEMLARRKGERMRWRLVLVLETIKTFLRFVILRLTRRPVLSYPTPKREIDLSALPSEVLDPPTDPSSTSPSSSQPILPLLPQGSALRNHLYPLASALPEQYLPHPLTLLPEIQDYRGYLAEMIHSSATLIQVLLFLRASKSPSHPSYRALSLPTLSRSLPPFFIPLLLRLLARHLRSDPSTVLLAQHQASQDRKLAIQFFATGPMWIGWTRPKIQGWIDRLGKWPVLGLMGDLAGGYLPLVDDYVYYTTS